MVTILKACYRAYRDLDATMVEINPLVITGTGDLVALDAKMTFDTNALFRRPQVAELRDRSQEDPREVDRRRPWPRLCRPRRRYRLHHQRRGPGDGDDGHDQAGRAASLRTSSTSAAAPRPERVVRAFRTVLADRNVSVILVNIFAGINRCDWVAEGVVQAYKRGRPDDTGRGAAGGHECRGGQAHHRDVGPAAHHRRHAGRGRRKGRGRASANAA